MGGEFKLGGLYVRYIQPNIIGVFAPFLFAGVIAGDLIEVSLYGNVGIGSEGPFAESWWYRNELAYAVHGLIVMAAILLLPITSLLPKYFACRRNLQYLGNMVLIIFILLSFI